VSGIYNNTLGCRVMTLAYDFCGRMGKLTIDRADHCDANAALMMFHALDRDVAQVNVFAGDERGRRDRAYIRIGGKWGVNDGGGQSLGVLGYTSQVMTAECTDDVEDEP
jgi:hypothetical protein